MKKYFISILVLLTSALVVFGQARVPLLVDPTNGIVRAPTNFLYNLTNLILWQGEELTPDGTEDYALIFKTSSNAFKKVKLNNLPSATGVTNTATNLPVTGIATPNTQGVFSARSGTELQFRSIKSAGSISLIHSDSDSITISNPLAGSGSITGATNYSGTNTIGPFAGVDGASLVFNSFNTNQYASNAHVISIKDGVVITNPVIWGSTIDIPTATIQLGGEFYLTNDMLVTATITANNISATNIYPVLATGPRVAVLDGTGRLTNSPINSSNLIPLLGLLTNVPLETRLTQLTNANTIYVRKDGNNTTAVRGDAKKPYASISHALKAATNGDTILVFPGEYIENMTNEAFTMAFSYKTNISLIGQGQPKVYATNTAYGDFIVISNSSDIKIQGMVFIGSTNRPFPTGDFANAINFAQSNKNVTISDCSFISWCRFGIVHKDWTFAWDENVVVANNYFYHIGSTNITGGAVEFDGAAIECGGGKGWLIVNNLIEKPFRGIELFTRTNNGIFDILIQGNTIYGAEGAGIIAINEFTNANIIKRVSINDNIIVGWKTNVIVGSSDSDNVGIEFRSGQSIDISHNKIESLVPPYAGILIFASEDDARGYNIVGNTIRDIDTSLSGSATGIRVFSGYTVVTPINGVNIVGNRISDIQRTGMYVQGNNINIAENQFQNIGWKNEDLYPAIWIYLAEDAGLNKATNIVIANNFFNDITNRTTDYGIRIDPTADLITAHGNYFGAGITPYFTNLYTNKIYLGVTTNDVLVLPANANPVAADDYVVAWSKTSNRVVRVSIATIDSGVGSIGLNGLTDVESAAATNKQVLTFDGSNWYPSNSVGGGESALSNLSDVNVPTPGDGEVLTYDTGTGKWVSLPAPGASSGDDITVNGGAIVNAGFTNKVDVHTANIYGIEWIKDGTNLVGYINFSSTHFRNIAGSNTITLAGELTNWSAIGTSVLLTTNKYQLTNLNLSFYVAAGTNYYTISNANLNFYSLAGTNYYTISNANLNFYSLAGTNYYAISNAILNGYANTVTSFWAMASVTNELINRATSSVTVAKGANVTITTNYSDGKVIYTVASTASGSGTVTGPTVSVSNQVSRFLGTDGTVITNSPVTITDAGTLTASNVVATNLEVYGAGQSMVSLYNTNGNINISIIAPGNLAANYNIILPYTNATANQVLASDGASNLYWVTMTAGTGTPAGDSGQIQFNTSDSFDASTNLTFNNTTKILTLTNGTLDVASNIIVRSGGAVAPGEVRLKGTNGNWSRLLVDKDHPSNTTFVLPYNEAMDGWVLRTDGTNTYWGETPTGGAMSLNSLSDVQTGGDEAQYQILQHNGITWTNVASPTFSNAVYSIADSASNAPSGNEFPTAGWVRSLFSGSGYTYYNSTNLTTFTNDAEGTPIYAFVPGIPAPDIRYYSNVVNNQYFGSVSTTNRFTYMSGPVVVDSYIGRDTGASKSLTAKAEIYYSYDGTNWLGDYDCSAQTITGGTNLYQFVISVPATTSTNDAGFYVQRRFKVVAASAAPNEPDVWVALGTNTASHIQFVGPNSAAGNAYLANNQTFTGTNIFTKPVELQGLVTATNLMPTNANLAAWGTVTTNQILFTNSLATLQPANANLSNWTTVVTNQVLFTNALSGLQPADADLTNWATVATNLILFTNSLDSLQPSDADLTNWATVATNLVLFTNSLQSLQPASANLTNFATVATNYFIPTNATLYHYLYVPAGAMLSTIYSNAESGTYTNGNLVKRDTYKFDDTAAEYAVFSATLGDGWDLGTLKAKFHFMCANTNVSTTNVTWAIRAGQTTNTAQILGSVTGTAVSTNVPGPILPYELIVSPASPAMTVGGTLQKGYPIEFVVYRDPANAGDTQLGDALLLAVEIQYGVKFNLSSGW